MATKNKTTANNPQPPASPAANLGAGLDASALPARYSEEEISARQAAYKERSPVLEVVRDRWDNEIEQGNPFEEAARPFQEANAGLHFRFLSPRHCKARGTRGYEKVIDPRTSQSVRVGTQELHCIPKDVQERRVRKNRAQVEANILRKREEYREAGRKAEVDSGGAIRMIHADDEIYEGNRRIA